MTLVGHAKREYQKAWIAKRKVTGFNLLGNICAGCAGSNNLEVDHIDPKTKDPSLRDTGTRSKGFKWSRSWAFIEQELKKCQLLCNSCHIKKSQVEQQVTHHGYTMYKNGCRCEICRKSKSLLNAKRYSSPSS